MINNFQITLFFSYLAQILIQIKNEGNNVIQNQALLP